MLALLASFLLIAYVVAPGVLFRAVFSLFIPLRAFDRTRTQEFSHSAVVCVLPFLLAIVLLWYTPCGQQPFPFADSGAQRDADYRVILLTTYSDKFVVTGDEFWSAVSRSGKRHGRLLAWYMGFVILEALFLGFVASKWGKIQARLAGWQRTEQLLTTLLLQHVSEWHVLLTNFLFPGTTIQADVLTGEDRLYRGEVLSYTLDRDGSLTGLYLANAERYDRSGLLADRDREVWKSPAEYWKPIPGRRLFIFADNLFTLNIRPQTTLAAAERLAAQLDPSASVTVAPFSDASPEEIPGLQPEPAGPVQSKSEATDRSTESIHRNVARLI